MIINTTSDLNLTYCNFVAECEILNSIYELDKTLLSESLEVVNEQINLDKIKNVLELLLDNISTLFAKFVEWAKRKIGDDSGFLKYYRKTIVETPLLEDTFTMYPYWLSINETLSATVPNFNYLQLKDDLDSDQDFIDAYFSKYSNAAIKENDIVTGAKILFRGKKVDPVPIKSGNIPMQRIYNFCVDFENVIKRVESDLRKIDKSAKECISYSNKLARTIEKQQKAVERVEPEVLKGEVEDGPRQLPNHESATPKVTFGRYTIHEADVVVQSKHDKATNNPDGTQKDSIKMNNVAGSQNALVSNNDAVSKENPAKDIERIKRYLKICSNFLSAKLAILQEQYNAYMFIFRHHVNSIKATARKVKAVEKQNEGNKKDSSASTDNKSKKPEKTVTLVGRYKAKVKD